MLPNRIRATGLTGGIGIKTGAAINGYGIAQISDEGRQRWLVTLDQPLKNYMVLALPRHEERGGQGLCGWHRISDSQFAVTGSQGMLEIGFAVIDLSHTEQDPS